jgi:hypothetical protein
MRDMLTDAGFVDIKITLKKQAREIIQDWMPGQGAEDYVTSVYLEARLPEDFVSDLPDFDEAAYLAEAAAAAADSADSVEITESPLRKKTFFGAGLPRVLENKSVLGALLAVAYAVRGPKSWSEFIFFALCILWLRSFALSSTKPSSSATPPVETTEGATETAEEVAQPELEVSEDAKGSGCAPSSNQAAAGC